ncbi:MAG: hypothetical protein IK150_03110 [Lachnospiraceae bacterium]|nr:hypothetical protein [Lachnospiraceae bacterium]
MTNEVYNSMIKTFESLSPSQCINRMYELTDESGRLEIPAWPSDYDLDQEGSYYALKMRWNRPDAAALIRNHAMLVDALAKIAEKWKNEELGLSDEENRAALGNELFEVWRTYVKSPDPEDMDCMKFYDIAEKMMQIAVREAGKNDAEFAPGKATVLFEIYENSDDVSVSLEELEYYNTYIDLIHEEAKRRLGGKYANYDIIIRAGRLCKLMAQEAPQIIIVNESRLLAQAMAVGRFAAEMRERKIIQ